LVVCVGDEETDKLTSGWLKDHIDRLQFRGGRLYSLELMAGYGRFLKAYKHRFLNTVLVDGCREMIKKMPAYLPNTSKVCQYV